ncbi:hypothetical protein MMPV_003346 [Pyropia vietnamensis]
MGGPAGSAGPAVRVSGASAAESAGGCGVAARVGGVRGGLAGARGGRGGVPPGVSREGAGRLPPPTVDASARVAAAAAELTRCRPRRAAVTPLETVYVSGVSRDARAHRLRAAVADLTGVDVRLVADVDRFGTTAAVTVVATAADALRAAVRSGPAASVLRLLPGADPWSAKLLGSRRREGLSAADAAGVAADFCRRRLTAKLEQLAVRPAMPPHLRASLRAHIEGALAAHGGGHPRLRWGPLRPPDRHSWRPRRRPRPLSPRLPPSRRRGPVRPPTCTLGGCLRRPHGPPRPLPSPPRRPRRLRPQPVTRLRWPPLLLPRLLGLHLWLPPPPVAGVAGAAPPPVPPSRPLGLGRWHLPCPPLRR